MRLQGTDGVRRQAVLSSSPLVAGLSPQKAFLEKDVITEQFVELYAYCRARQLLENGVAAGEFMVVGWDPRDPSGAFTGAAVSGVLKAGLNVHSIGVMPTPAIVIYMRSVNAAGALVITASHNPASYNGIKIFTRHGFKLLPGDDDILSAKVLCARFSAIAELEPAGKLEERRAEAVEVFTRFSINPANSWIGSSEAVSKTILVVDCANGAFSGIAAPVFEKAGFGKVVEANASLDGNINLRSGVADIEGLHEITPEMLEPKGRLNGYSAVTAVLELGRQYAEDIKSGMKHVSGAVFDGDGDRLFRLDYDPFTDSIIVLSGDELAILQARHRAEKDRGKQFVNSVESDLNAAGEAVRLGFTTELTAVGDKWILLSAQVAALRPTAPAEAMRAIEANISRDDLSADFIEKTMSENGLEFCQPSECGFAVGAEESGHSIIPGVVDSSGKSITVFAGNGLKGALNAFAATAGLTGSITAKEIFNLLRSPFPAGFKKTMYVYYVEKTRWKRGAALWEDVKKTVTAQMAPILPDMGLEEMVRPEEPDMLYMKITRGGAHVASLFIRNSGTEDKTGVNLRGPQELAQALLELGETAVRLIIEGMKDGDKRFAIAERKLILAAADGGVPQSPVMGLGGDEYHRLLNETANKQYMLTGAYAGAGLTERGLWYLELIKRGMS
ncbi:MAG: hypothetical protein HY751_00625 [Nitrospinae bacterium]|nr:hypothetical protein [Nitrospinota bacterium]